MTLINFLIDYLLTIKSFKIKNRRSKFLEEKKINRQFIFLDLIMMSSKIIVFILNRITQSIESAVKKNILVEKKER